MSIQIQSINTLKGLAILAVMVIHTEPFLASPILKDNWIWYYFGHALQQIASFAVPFFFVTAGFIFTHDIEKQRLSDKWWKYTSRLSMLLLIWVLIDGVNWGKWLEEIIKTQSYSSILWHIHSSHLLKKPDISLFKGVVTLWFLVSLITSVSFLALCIRFSIRPAVLLVMGACAYAFSLITSFYSDTPLGIGISLPIEERGPFIAFACLTIGHYFARRHIQFRFSALLLAFSLLMVFAESAALSYFTQTPFQERPYLFSTLLLAGSVLLYAIQNPTFGAQTIFSKIGNRSFGIYLVHTPVLGGLGLMRVIVIHPIWEVLIPFIVLALSYAIVNALLKVPYVRASVM